MCLISLHLKLRSLWMLTSSYLLLLYLNPVAFRCFCSLYLSVVVVYLVALRVLCCYFPSLVCTHPVLLRRVLRCWMSVVFLDSRQVDQEAAPGGSEVDADATCRRQAGARVDLPAAGRQRHRLEANPLSHCPRKLYQYNRQFRY